MVFGYNTYAKSIEPCVHAIYPAFAPNVYTKERIDVILISRGDAMDFLTDKITSFLIEKDIIEKKYVDLYKYSIETRLLSTVVWICSILLLYTITVLCFYGVNAMVCSIAHMHVKRLHVQIVKRLMKLYRELRFVQLVKLDICLIHIPMVVGMFFTCF